MLKKFEKNAERKLPRMVFDYYAGGSNDEITLKNNIHACLVENTF
jgi:isopentenyl diphosphate isomerase/L-lactate dehydrogenase-like FMN-dependent dehydrogenase